MLVQLHWQNPNNPQETMLVSQADCNEGGFVIGTDTDVGQWAHGKAMEKLADRPEGWEPLVCNESDERFWWKFGDKIGPRNGVAMTPSFVEAFASDAKLLNDVGDLLHKYLSEKQPENEADAERVRDVLVRLKERLG